MNPRRIARRFQAQQSGSIWVNVWDDSPPSVPVELDFDFKRRSDEYKGPFPLDTVWRWNFIQWLKAQTAEAGYVVHDAEPRWRGEEPPGASKNNSVPAYLRKQAAIEKVFIVENPEWPGLHPAAPWNERAHHRFLDALQELYSSLGPWMGIPLAVSCES